MFSDFSEKLPEDVNKYLPPKYGAQHNLPACMNKYHRGIPPDICMTAVAAVSVLYFSVRGDIAKQNLLEDLEVTRKNQEASHTSPKKGKVPE